MTEAGADNGQVIQSMNDVEAIRTRPEAVLGSKGVEGATHTVIEIVGNTLDERNNGYGDQVRVDINPEKAIVAVRDYGRGVPMGWNESESAYNSFLIFGRDNAGGKYDDNAGLIKTMRQNPDLAEEGGNNCFTIGLNGKGAFATQASSKWFRVDSFHGGKRSWEEFEMGISTTGKPQVEDTDEPDGTLITWQPDISVFKGAKSTSRLMNMNRIRQFLKDSSLISGMKMALRIFEGDSLDEENLKDTEVFEPVTLPERVYSEWIDAETGEKVKDSAEEITYITSGLFFHGVDKDGNPLGSGGGSEENMGLIDLAFGPKYQDGEPVRDIFVNQVRSSSDEGVLPDQARNALQDVFQPHLKEMAGVTRIPRGVDLMENINMVISAKVANPYFRNQTKDALDNDFMGTQLYTMLYNSVGALANDPDSWVHQWIQAVAESIENAREQKQLRDLRREVDKTSRRERPSDKHKPSGAYARKRWAEDELWLVEGNSAGSAVKGARDSSFQSLYYLRGKPLNVYKTDSFKQILENSEIRDVMRILSCGIDMPGQDITENTNVRACRTGKIIIASDADMDGFHIRLLLFTMFWKLWRPLVMGGYLYVANTPLYRVTWGKNEEFFFDGESLAEFMKENGLTKSNSRVNRFKGLGETNPDVLSKTTVNPATRDLIPLEIAPEDESRVDDVLEIMFGSDTRDRKSIMLEGILQDVDPGVRETVLAFVNSSEFEDKIEPLKEETLEI